MKKIGYIILKEEDLSFYDGESFSDNIEDAEIYDEYSHAYQVLIAIKEEFQDNFSIIAYKKTIWLDRIGIDIQDKIPKEKCKCDKKDNCSDFLKKHINDFSDYWNPWHPDKNQWTDPKKHKIYCDDLDWRYRPSVTSTGETYNEQFGTTTIQCNCNKDGQCSKKKDNDESENELNKIIEKYGTSYTVEISDKDRENDIDDFGIPMSSLYEAAEQQESINNILENLTKNPLWNKLENKKKGDEK